MRHQKPAERRGERLPGTARPGHRNRGVQCLAERLPSAGGRNRRPLTAPLMSTAGAVLGLYLGAFIASHGNPAGELKRAAGILSQAIREYPVPLDMADPRFGTSLYIVKAD